MESRKVIKLGKSTLVVSLPKTWIKSKDLKQGDSLVIADQVDGSLAIYAEAPDKERYQLVELSVDPREKKNNITRRIISCYLNGYSSIKLVSQRIFTPEQHETIRNLSAKLYMGVMEATSKVISLQSLVDLTKIPIDVGIRRMHTVALSMCRDSIQALKDQNKDLATTVIALDDEVDRFSFPILRVLRTSAQQLIMARELGIDSIDCFDYQTVTYSVEYIADRAVNISENVLKLKNLKTRLPPFLLEPLSALADKIIESYETTVEAFFSKDLKSAHKIIDLRVDIAQLADKVSENIIRERHSAVVCTTCSIQHALLGIAENAIEIAEATINRVVGRVSLSL